MSQRLNGVERAIAAFRAGEPVLIHDFADREGETDLVYPAANVTADDVARLRNDAGGLICVAVSHAVAERFDLPFAVDVIDHPASRGTVAYDERSSFSFSVNHVDTYTGITDSDRSQTIVALAEAAADGLDAEAFAAEFRAPGHVTLLRAAPSLAERRGHTELGIALAAAAEREPAVVVCEMLDDASGGPLSPEAARDYAARHGLAYVEGADLVEHLG